MKKLIVLIALLLPCFCEAQTVTPTPSSYKIWIVVPVGTSLTANMPAVSFPTLNGGQAFYSNSVSAVAFLSVSPFIYNSLTPTGKIISVDWRVAPNALSA